MEIEDINGLEDRLDGKANVVHPHATSDITGLVEALADKAPLDHTHDIADFPDIADSIGQSFAPTVHTHSISQVTNLQTALDAKSNSGHGHSIANVTGLQAALDSKSADGHGHQISDITGLQTALSEKGGIITIDTTPISNSGNAISSGAVHTALAGKANATHTHTLSQISDLSGELSQYENVNSDWNEGNPDSAAYIVGKPTLGTAASRNVGTLVTEVAAGFHTHDAAAIVSGTIDLARLPAIPGVGAVVASGTSLTSLTADQQAQIVSGSTVVLSNGDTYIYDGSGSKTDVANYVKTSSSIINYSDLIGIPVNATPNPGGVAGLMSALDKTKLDEIEAGATNYIHPTGDGNLHVPATVVGTTNHNGKYLKAGATAGALSWATPTASEVGAAPTSHAHGNISSDGKLTGTTTSGLPVITGTAGAIVAGTATTFAAGTHAHGQITSSGAIENVTERRLMVTSQSGAIGVLSDTGTSGQYLKSMGSSQYPMWEDFPSSAASDHGHGQITNDGKVGSQANRLLVTGTAGAVTALGTGTANQILTLNSSGVPTWTTPSTTTVTSVANISGGNANEILYQSAANTTAKLAAAVTPASGFSLLRNRGSSLAPMWQDVGNIVTKSQDEYVATDKTSSTPATVTKIQRVTAAQYSATNFTKDPTTLYIVIG